MSRLGRETARLVDPFFQSKKIAEKAQSIRPLVLRLTAKIIQEDKQAEQEVKQDVGEVEAAALCTDVVQVFSVESPKPTVSEAPGFGRHPTFSDVSLMRSARTTETYVGTEGSKSPIWAKISGHFAGLRGPTFRKKSLVI